MGNSVAEWFPFALPSPHNQCELSLWNCVKNVSHEEHRICSDVCHSSQSGHPVAVRDTDSYGEALIWCSSLVNIFNELRWLGCTSLHRFTPVTAAVANDKGRHLREMGRHTPSITPHIEPTCRIQNAPYITQYFLIFNKLDYFWTFTADVHF